MSMIEPLEKFGLNVFGLNIFHDSLNQDEVDHNIGSTLTTTLRFGKGSKKWIYLPDKEISTRSNKTNSNQTNDVEGSKKTYDTNFQGWVNKYADF